MKNFDWIICGGGVRGIFCAYQLNKLGFSVAIIESAPTLGGVLSSLKYESFYLDLGCHLFDNADKEVTKMMVDLSQNKINEVQVEYSSKLMGHTSKNFAVPDFTLENKIISKIRDEMISSKNNKKKVKNLSDYFKTRYGNTASIYLEKASKKILREDAKNLDSDSKNVLPFNRIVIASDKETVELKNNNQYLKDKIANSQKYKIFPKEHLSFMNFYPKKFGTYGFVKNAEQYLKKRGVEIFSNTKIRSLKIKNSHFFFETDSNKNFTSEFCFWSSDLKLIESLPGVNINLGNYIHKVPMILYYFFLNKKQVTNQTYIHNFDEENYIYRSSSPGLYGGQFDKNSQTYVCFEITSDVGSKIWNNPEIFSTKIWNEAVSMGQVTGNEPEKKYIIKTPVSFKPVIKGFSKEYEIFLSRVRNQSEKLFISNPSLYSKIQVASEIKDIIKNLSK